jgi:hypothetical protein
MAFQSDHGAPSPVRAPPQSVNLIDKIEDDRDPLVVDTHVAPTPIKSAWRDYLE